MSDEKEMINYSAFRFMSEYKICIPIIQREYIQGCHDQRIINTTNKMIDDILTALRNERERVNLNIIYGYSENNVFFPIDGQQRLTALYIGLLGTYTEKLPYYRWDNQINIYV